MILKVMYNGEFYPCETVVPTSSEYRKAVTACEKLEENESHFKYGFSAGLIVQQEAHEQVQQKKEK